MNATGRLKVGRIAWHDLMTHDVAKARRFYADLLGWEYRIEHAVDFAWGSGEAEYPLILAHGQAQGGFVDPGKAIPLHWVAYVEVEDVDAAVAKARALGATIDREPFDVPGVGRSAMIRDPQGAVICPHLSTHGFPPPSGTFLWDELVTEDVESAKRFYGELFGWQASDVETGKAGTYTLFKDPSDVPVAGVLRRPPGEEGMTAWMTYLATEELDVSVAKAKRLGAIAYLEGMEVANVGRLAVLVDPTGAAFGLFTPNEP